MKQLPAAKVPKLKNHIAPKGKLLSQTLDRKFGVSLADFDRAIGGDVSAAQKIGELARQGRLSQELAPRLAQAYIEIINGSEAYNKATADILLQAGKSAIAIDKAGSQVMLGQQKFVHSRQELAQEFVIGKNSENSRHAYQMNFTQIKGYVDAHLTEVDRQSAVLEQSNRPEIKQVAADEAYQTKTMNEALSKGETARYDLIPEKNYTGIKGRFQEFMGALGF
ncbi:MAG: hypothetical protein AN485_07480 [Anabaena sp. MDT14b]|nr:MAG: hypothetical protein AN485_07480 [Anabaena sp. MDT14b]